MILDFKSPKGAVFFFFLHSWSFDTDAINKATGYNWNVLQLLYKQLFLSVSPGVFEKASCSAM